MTIAVARPITQLPGVPLPQLDPSDLTSFLLSELEPPPANRGLFPQIDKTELNPAVDYLNLSLPDIDISNLMELVQEIEDFGKTSFVVNKDRGGKCGSWYESTMVCPLNGRIFYEHRVITMQNYRALIQLPAKLIGRMGQSALFAIVREIDRLGGHVSRVDIKVDDYERDLNYEAVRSGMTEGRFTTFSKSQEIANYNNQVGRDGFTFNFGSRQSERMVRIYDAAPVHGLDATRFEGEYKGEIAKAIGKMIARSNTDEEVVGLLGGILNGTMRFTATLNKKNSSRVESCEWWNRFSNRLAIACKVQVDRVTPTLSKKLLWLREKCAKSLALFCQYFQGTYQDELTELIKSGASRLNKNDLALLKAAGRDGLTMYYGDDRTIVEIVDDPEWFRAWMFAASGNAYKYEIPF